MKIQSRFSTPSPTWLSGNKHPSVSDWKTVTRRDTFRLTGRAERAFDPPGHRGVGAPDVVGAIEIRQLHTVNICFPAGEDGFELSLRGPRP
ncbi:hypothetical protein N7501_004227 [Penicillium viridicatum]|nr:hypothetical protein N7501_004227 [Penicillium viridicatum]